MSLTNYPSLITSEHADKPNFVAIVTLLCSGSVDTQAAVQAMPGLYDVDAAVGDQLDACGVWVALPRTVAVPTLGTVTLSDTDYRILIRARILRNHWDGGMSSLQGILAVIFPGSITMFAVDNQDMSMDIYIAGGTPTATQLALLKGGLLVPKPEGVLINFILATTALFGLDFETSLIAGPDVGSFINYL